MCIIQLLIEGSTNLKNIYFISRTELQTILHDEFDHEFEQCFVRKQREKSKHAALFALGPWHQEHSDGHEKLSEQGLSIGKGIQLPIYGNKDQYSSWVHELILLPNIWKPEAMVHYYLELIERHECEYSFF